MEVFTVDNAMKTSEKHDLHCQKSDVYFYSSKHDISVIHISQNDSYNIFLDHRNTSQNFKTLLLVRSE